jgi:hypothetical protein
MSSSSGSRFCLLQIEIRDQKQLMCQSVSKNDILLPQSKDPGVEEIFVITVYNFTHAN